jgi:hypothetical protein
MLRKVKLAPAGDVVRSNEKANFREYKNGELIWEGKLDDFKYSSSELQTGGTAQKEKQEKEKKGEIDKKK